MAQVVQHEAGETIVIAIEGELDASSSAALPDRLLPLIPSGSQVRLDLSRVPYMSSAGLRALLLVYRHSKDIAAQIKITGMQAEIRFIMSATGFLDLFDIDDTSAA